MTDSIFTRRHFLQTTIAAAGAAALPLRPLFAGALTAAMPAAKYTRYNVMHPGGQKALASYAKAIDVMLKLPPDHPHNWFRNAFTHLMDCPHGNWWFYVWHRGYVGYFEQTIRNLSGDPTFAMPYWDWTTLPQIPDSMFDGVLTPASPAFEPYTRNLGVFTAALQPAMTKYWNSLNAAQLAQLKLRGYATLDDLWNDVTGYAPTLNPPQGISGNMAYANTCGSRYLTRDNPKLDANTAKNVSSYVIYSGLLAPLFYSPQSILSFNSTKTSSHITQPNGATKFSVLEGLPHNKVHNYIGGVGPVDPGPYGNMTNFLSPVDPIFFLHHANMDRLWDIWTRKQKSLNQPYLPVGADLSALSNEVFQFYVDGNGNYVGTSHAGDYLSTDRFNYDYEPGFGEDVIQQAQKVLASNAPARPPVAGTVHGNTASVAIPTAAIKSHLDSTAASSLIAEITLPHPSATAVARDFDVIVGAPADQTRVGADSPFFAGTISFFGHMSNMKGMPMNATFAVPLPKAAQAFRGTEGAKSTAVNIRIVPSYNHGQAPPLIKSVLVHSR